MYFSVDATIPLGEQILHRDRSYASCTTHVCFFGVRRIPQKYLGFACNVIPDFIELGKLWNEAFPDLPVGISTVGISWDGYCRKEQETQNVAIVEVLYDLPLELWYIPLLPFRILSTEELYVSRLGEASGNILQKVFTVGTVVSNHNIVNPDVVDLFAAYKNLYRIREEVVKRFLVIPNHGSFSGGQSMIFGVIADILKETL
jgi:hypothetical protein